MPSLNLAAGRLRVSYPDSYEVASQPPADAAEGHRGANAVARTGPVGPADGVSATLIDAFAAQSLELVEPFELVPSTPSMPAGSSEPSLAGPQPGASAKIHVELDLRQDEDAVVLLEQDGFFSWQLPASPHTTPGQPASSPDLPPDGGPAQALDPARMASQVARFEADVAGPVRAYVLKFASRFVPGALISFLERHTRPGLVVMTGNDVSGWPLVDDLTQVTLPQGRSAKILLFVHGAFSTTVGSFGILTSTGPGQQFLAAAASSYDAIIGFDHRTLSRDPLENAVDLHSRLGARTLADPPTIDIVSYSRGGLVTRSLIEYLLPSSTWHADIGNVVFVGATNAGTALAEPDNWRVLLDLHTNLTAATARSVASSALSAPPAEIVAGMVSGIGAFVRYLASPPVAGLGIPGLAALEPDGPFITGINGTQPGQPAAGTPWHVISSDFEARLGDDHNDLADLPDLPELPRELVVRLADGLVDKLMGTTNDLVVDTASMSAVDLPSGGGFIKDSLSFGTNDVVHHLNYFIQPKTCEALRTWLT